MYPYLLLALLLCGGTFRHQAIQHHTNIHTASLYDAPPVFDQDGFARVTKKGVPYLVDTTGRAYKLATDVTQLDSTIRALILSGKSLTAIPAMVFEHPELEVLRLDNNNIKTIPSNFPCGKKVVCLPLSHGKKKF